MKRLCLLLLVAGLLGTGCASKQAMMETFREAPPLKTWEEHPRQRDRFPLDQVYMSEGSLVTKGKVNKTPLCRLQGAPRERHGDHNSEGVGLFL